VSNVAWIKIKLTHSLGCEVPWKENISEIKIRRGRYVCVCVCVCVGSCTYVRRVQCFRFYYFWQYFDQVHIICAKGLCSYGWLCLFSVRFFVWGQKCGI
jgi:hypothetical protein